eukprot:TRINITY_DN884_c0_g1_i2.p1 TRINITY_DN884_c0_g1~~TRINITY_DN884_c0_g1_i2.p1  ORF type:complete len:165 (+),score=28.13 TRINITY_DN884_c0_g1_i2:34-528(+)
MGRFYVDTAILQYTMEDGMRSAKVLLSVKKVCSTGKKLSRVLIVSRLRVALVQDDRVRRMFKLEDVNGVYIGGNSFVITTKAEAHEPSLYCELVDDPHNKPEGGLDALGNVLQELTGIKPAQVYPATLASYASLKKGPKYEDPAKKYRKWGHDRSMFESMIANR